MPHIAEILILQGLVGIVQALIEAARLVRPGREMGQDALQVLYAIGAGLHSIVAQVLGLTTGIGLAGLAVAEPETGVTAQAVCDQPVGDDLVFIGIGATGAAVT